VSAVKRLYAKFQGPEIFLEKGRIMYSVLRAFSSAGYQIRLFDRFGEKPLERYGQLACVLPGVSLTDAPPDDVEDSFYLFDTPDRALADLPWRRLMEVKFDLFSPYWFSDPIIMPYPMYPPLYALADAQIEALRACERRVRVFFAGDVDHYSRVWVRYPKPKLPRQRVIETVKQRLAEHVVAVQDTGELADLLAAGYTNKCVLNATSAVRIDPADWLPTMARADFFLSPPGIVMPMCHNIIEAMAVGTIPITNYPEWLDPPLTHGENCIVFGDEDDLVAKLILALGMGPEKIACLRRNVIDYYQRHLRAEDFVRRIELRPEHRVVILMYTERNMARNHKRLGRHSILMQGTVMPRPKYWHQRMLATYLKGNRAAGTRNPSP
jgi:hypothetical protein